MKLSSSVGDFNHYVEQVADMVACFKDTKFRYINLELSGNCPELLSKSDADLERFVESCRAAAERANISYVLSHAPCLHNAVLPALSDRDNEEYRECVRIIRRSVEVYARLGIKDIVIHACIDKSFDKSTFYKYNTMFYKEFFDLAEKYGINILTENWDSDATAFSTGGEMREFIDSVNHPLLGACWDSAHGNIARNAREIGQYKNILVLGDKLKALHLSDNFGDSHHHSWPFAGIINFDEIMQGLIDVNYKGYFNFEASYTLLHHKNMPYHRTGWEYQGKPVTKLLDPPIALKQKAVDLLYDIGKYILEAYNCFEE